VNRPIRRRPAIDGRVLSAGLSASGAFVCIGLFAKALTPGAWPLRDSADFWLAGRHVIEGTAVCGSNPDGYLIFPYAIFPYAPPVAVLSACSPCPDGWG
jgi:hypothetical protein